MSWEGSLVNLVYGIAAGDTDVEEEFTGYYDSNGKIQAITPTMVARLVRSSAKQVTQTLASVGFEVEWRWADINKDNQLVKKRTRACCIPDSQTWSEVISRYYYSEVGEKPDEVPECLTSHKFHRVTGSVPSVPHVPETPGDNGHGTHGTLGTVYVTRHGHNGDKPEHPCHICGSNNWWQRDGEWVCGKCHPDPHGEFMFKLS
jgi:hypothetical protein